MGQIVADIRERGCSDEKFPYMMLSRLQQDCEYFLNHGNRCEKHLWAGNVVDHIAEMKELHAWMQEKPEWLTMDQINEYEKQMLN